MTELLVSYCKGEWQGVLKKLSGDPVKNDLSNLKSGDSVSLLTKEQKLVHSAFFLGNVSGKNLFLSKIGKGPLAVHTLKDLYKVYTSSSLLVKWTEYEVCYHSKPIK